MEGPKSFDGIQPPKPLSEVVPKSVDAVRAGSRLQERTPKPLTQEKSSWLKDFFVGKELESELEASEFPSKTEEIEPERLPIEEQMFQGNTGVEKSEEEKRESTDAVKDESQEELLPEEILDQAREEAKALKEANLSEETEEPEQLPVEGQMVQETDATSAEFEETGASGATTEMVQKAEEAVAQESESEKSSEKVEKRAEWREIRENYKAYRAQVKDAETVFLEASKKFEKERRNAGMLRRFIATPDLDIAKNEMIQAQYAYDNLLEGLRGHRQERMDYFVKERLKNSADKSTHEIDALTEYVARHETILEHHIDNEVQVLEGLRYQENEKGESRYKLVRGMKIGFDWYRKRPLKQRILIGAGVGFGFGTAAALAGFATGGVLATGGVMAARRAGGGFFGSIAALATKTYIDRKTDEHAERSLKDLHETFKETSLRQSREDRRAIQRDVRFKKKASTVSAIGAAMVAGGAGSLATGEAYTAVVDAPSVSLGLPDSLKSKLGIPLNKDMPPQGHDTYVPESSPKTEIPPTPESGDVAVLPKTETPPSTNIPESGDTAVPEEKKYSSVEDASLSTKPDIAELLKKLGIGEEEMCTDKQASPYEISKDINVAPNEPTPDVSQMVAEKDASSTSESISKNENVFGRQDSTSKLSESAPEKGIVLKGVYETGSSVEGELQDFLKNDTWVKEKYPDLTDVERGKIAHRIQQGIANDSDMMKGFNITGENWHKVKVNGAYEVTLDKDMLSNEIEKIHAPKSAPVEVPPPQEKPPVSKLSTEQDVKPESESTVKTTTHESIPESKTPDTKMPRTIREDLVHAKEVLKQGGPDYYGASTRPALRDLFKEGYFYGSPLAGQKNLIMSYWGPMSHVRLEDIYDGNNSLEYKIGDNPPVKMGAEVEHLTRGIVTKLEQSLHSKIPDVTEIIQQSRLHNDTLGDLINKLHLRLEEVEPFRPKVAVPRENLPTAESVLDSQTVPKNSAVLENKPTLQQDIERIPLVKYEAPKVEWSTDSVYGTRAVAKLPPIEVTPEISKLVEIKYPIEDTEWRSLTAHQFYNSENNHSFRDMVHAQLTDIAVALKGASDTPLAKFTIDWSAYDAMKPSEVMQQLEQHEAMLKKLQSDVPKGQVIETKKF